MKSPTRHLHLRRRILAAFALALVQVATTAAAERVFRAGAATSNITPPLGTPIVGGWQSPPATDIHDELHVRCLALDDGQTRLVFAICDSVGVPRELLDQAKRQASQATGVPVENMLMSATHTHSAGSTRSSNRYIAGDSFNDYQNFVVRRIADGVARAVANLEPARIAWGSVDDPSHLFNRRYHMKPGVEIINPFGERDQVVMNPGVGNPDILKPAGPIDPQISFLAAQALDGRPIALFANYSLHYVGGVEGASISADYFAMFADRVQQLLSADRLDPPFMAAMTNGTSGDVNNIHFMGKPERRKPYEKMRLVGHAVAQKVYEAHQSVTYHDWVPLGALTRELVLRTRRPTQEQLERAERLLSGELKPVHARDLDYAKRMPLLAELPPEVSVPLQTLRIGPVGIAAMPFEVFTETGLELKRRAPFQPEFNIELANGSFGYLPTPEQHALGGYETWLGTNYVEIDASRKITETLLDMFAKLKETGEAN